MREIEEDEKFSLVITCKTWETWQV